MGQLVQCNISVGRALAQRQHTSLLVRMYGLVGTKAAHFSSCTHVWFSWHTGSTLLFLYACMVELAHRQHTSLLVRMYG
jgi:hypothetical protein